MAAVPPVCNFGEKAHAFELPATDGRRYRLDELKGPKGTVIVFMCNHCPYVKAVIDRLIEDAKVLAAIGEALGLPDTYGQNLDALEDSLRDVDTGTAGLVLLWDGWSTLARSDERTFLVLLDIFRTRASAAGKAPLTVLLRGDGPDVPGLASLD